MKMDWSSRSSPSSTAHLKTLICQQDLDTFRFFSTFFQYLGTPGTTWHIPLWAPFLKFGMQRAPGVK